MLHIAIIGVGGLGMRYVQSLAHFRYEAKIQIVDISDQALEKTKELFYSMKPEKHLILESFHTLEGLEEHLDIVAVATGSKPRRKLTENLLDTKHVKYLILEKVLFPQVEDYMVINRKIEEHGCKVWVNCGRREQEFFKQLKEEFAGEPFEFSLTGGAWGLGCNTVHFLDLISFITGDTEKICIYSKELDREIIQSKRSGYIEFTGTLTGNMGKCRSFSITSDRGADAPIIYVISSKNRLCIVKEFDKKAVYFESKNHWEGKEVSLQMKLQSEITAPLFEKIVETGSCNLSDYETAMKIHVPFLQELLKFMNRHNETDTDMCPIT